MFPRWWRLGIRPQITIIVILGAVLSTVATLFIADNAIQNYVLEQARTQEHENMNIANLVLQNQYGQNISIASDNTMVADLPGSGKDFSQLTAPYGKYVLNNSIDFVDSVKTLIGNSVSIYQCANAFGAFTGCQRISTTYAAASATNGARETGVVLPTAISRNMDLTGSSHEWLGVDTTDGKQYYSDYLPIKNPQNQVIGVLYVGVPLGTITGVVQRTTVELVLIGTIIMIAGVVLALFFASTVVNTLQRAARQISGASERMGGIAAQQANGSAQQVWAINAINQALQNFSETAKDISHRTDQLALMGNQVLQRRSEISPTQIDSILAYITRSVRDISVASKQQAAQYERMTGAMQAVIEIAEQVAGNSQAASESSERLELVVRQLQRVVGVRTLPRSTTTDELGGEMSAEASAANGQTPKAAKGTVRAVRPGAKARRGGSGMGLANNGMANNGMERAGRSGGIGGGVPPLEIPAMPARPSMGAMQPMQAQRQPISSMGMAPPLPGGGMAGAGMSGSARQPANMNGMYGAGNGMYGAGNGMNGMYGAGNGGPGGYAMGQGRPMGRPGQFNQQPDPRGVAQPEFLNGNDWRLPPMPDLPAMPGWDGGQVSAQSMGRMPQPGEQGSRNGPPARAGMPPFLNDGRGRPDMSGPSGLSGRMSGPNNDNM
ncbi:MAG: Cache 3/Cache 2 fusion domain-containing protein [Ktedonobacterales bacterium]